MDIRPVDMQLMINKASDVNRVNSENQRNSEQQQLFNDAFQKELNEDMRKALETNKSEEENITDREGGNKGQGKDSKKKQSKKKEEGPVKNKSTSFFDVSI